MGSSGGSAGAVSYPLYMSDYFSDLTIGLGAGGGSTMTMDIVTAMNTAQTGGSPYVSVTAYDPDTEVAAMLSAISDFETLVALLSSGTGLDTVISDILSTTRIDTEVDNAVTEFSADLADRLTVEVLPRFQAGMRDINAVVSSAFTIGQAVIETSQTRQVSKYSSELHLQEAKSYNENSLQIIALKLEYQKFLSHQTIEANRIKIVAKTEEAETNLEIDEADASWDLEVFQHGANMLAAIGGGTALSQKKKKNKMASAIGGAMTGAAAGAMIGAEVGTVGGPWGAVIGAVVGAAAGLLL